MVEKLQSKEFRAFISANSEASVHQLLLSKQVLEGDDLKLAVQQIDGRQRIQNKLPSWYRNSDIIYPIHISLEQCSSETTASYKSNLFSGEQLIDLTGGFGVDTTFLAKKFQKVFYVEQNQELANIANHNFNALGLTNIQVLCEDSSTILAELDTSFDLIYVDPARRDKGGGKLVSMADCEPNILELMSDFRRYSKSVLLKLSPMLDLTVALKELPETTTVYVLSVNNECKELLLYIDFMNSTNEVEVNCLNFTSSGNQAYTFNLSNEPITAIHYTDRLGKYIYEPNASIRKVGGFNTLVEKYKVDKLHPNSHLYTSDVLVESFPGRIFEVIEAFGFDKKSQRSFREKVKKANLSIRNFPSSVAQLRKRLKLSDGGDDYVFATTLADEKKVLIRSIKVE